MRILKLRFKNLNSLYGEWLIDFTDPEFISNGIFALTGPTGAGKSTILDAICLALYGSTPRLGKITKSGNEIMSRQTGECFAEVVFESQAGQFRCHWAQHRARKNFDGDLQTPRHEIAEADSDGALLESQTRRVLQVIEEKTGMDFDRFTRSILLAQGGFDTFLKADAEQKSKILEQITGTEIYSDISRRVHERKRDEREQLNLLQAETSGIEILDSEQEKELEQCLSENQIKETNLTEKTTKIGQAIVWLKSINDLKIEIEKLADNSAKLQTEVELFKPKREQMEQAIKAASLDGAYATLCAIRKQQVADSSSVQAEEKRLPELEEAAATHTELLKSAEQKTIQVKGDLKVAAPLIQKVRSLDQSLAEQNRSILNSEGRLKEDAEAIDGYQQTSLIENENRVKAELKLNVSESYFKEHSHDEWLMSGLAGVEEQLSDLITRQGELTQKETDLKNADVVLNQAIKKLEESSKKKDTENQKLHDYTRKIQQEKEALGKLLGDRLLREYSKEKETLLREMAFQSKITELEDHRDKLIDGKPCPLCGSESHPFAEGNVPVVDDIELKIESLSQLISHAESIDTRIKKLEHTEITARKVLTDSEKLEAIVSANQKSADKTCTELNESLEKLHKGFEQQKQKVLKKLQPLGITEIQEKDISSLLESLKKRLKAWQNEVSNKITVEQQISVIDSELTRLAAVISTKRAAFSDKQNQLEALKIECTSANEERKKLYAAKNPNTEEINLKKVIEDAELAEYKSREKASKTHQSLIKIKHSIESLNNDIKQRTTELNQLEAHFSTSVNKVGFINERNFLEAKRTTEEMNALAERAKELDDGQNTLWATKKDRELRLSNEIDKKLTLKTLEELDPEYEENESSLKELRDAISGFKHKLTENSVAKERIKEKQGAIDNQKVECHRWEKLHDLIGSADGKKYRNFAQGLTFELMVSHANQQLAKMSDRYLLMRDKEQPLELNVVDSYQAGEIRSTKNLSGGESFIVSLTLALGLSKMASRKVRVDSLFLDEGFGTLDEDSLEIALETLSSLQQDGKLIGVISHVNALKERISTQIKVTPKSSGRSIILGPGCMFETSDL